MTDDKSLIETILTNPRDDGPRLVFADWLEERGDPRGEVIRTYVDLKHRSYRIWHRAWNSSGKARLPSYSAAQSRRLILAYCTVQYYLTEMAPIDRQALGRPDLFELWHQATTAIELWAYGFGFTSNKLEAALRRTADELWEIGKYHAVSKHKPRLIDAGAHARTSLGIHYVLSRLVYCISCARQSADAINYVAWEITHFWRFRESHLRHLLKPRGRHIAALERAIRSVCCSRIWLELEKPLSNCAELPYEKPIWHHKETS